MNFEANIENEELGESEWLDFCFDEYISWSKVWNPTSNYRFRDNLNLDPPPASLPLKDATGITVDHFFIENKSVNRPCIRTSRDMWTKIIRQYNP